MKKLLMILLLLSSICFGSEFKSYENIYFFECIKLLNNLSKDYLVVSYKITPYKIDKVNYHTYSVEKFNMIVEIENIETY